GHDLIVGKVDIVAKFDGYRYTAARPCFVLPDSLNRYSMSPGLSVATTLLPLFGFKALTAGPLGVNCPISKTSTLFRLASSCMSIVASCSGTLGSSSFDCTKHSQSDSAMNCLISSAILKATWGVDDSRIQDSRFGGLNAR